MRVGILGLGEAGSKIAADLAQSGHDVHAWDPVAVETPPLVARASSDREVVAGAAVVISVTTAAHAVAAAASVGPALQPHQVYADLNTCLPAKKREVGGMIASSKADTKSGVPILKDIPILGALFRTTRNVDTRRELVILIRPTVLQTPEAAAAFAKDQRNALPATSAAADEFEESERKLQEEEKLRMEKKNRKLYKKEGFSK